MDEEQTVIDARRDALVADGYSYAVAEALAERGVTVEKALHLSHYEVLDHYLAWNGIHGYTQGILDAIADITHNGHM